MLPQCSKIFHMCDLPTPIVVARATIFGIGTCRDQSMTFGSRSPSIIRSSSAASLPVLASPVLYFLGFSLICLTEPSQCVSAIIPQPQPCVHLAFPRDPSLGCCYLLPIFHPLLTSFIPFKFVFSSTQMTLSCSSH